jgi:hypothetical protein
LSAAAQRVCSNLLLLLFFWLAMHIPLICYLAMAAGSGLASILAQVSTNRPEVPNLREVEGVEILTAIIGPDEPTNPQTHPGPFASLYDQGRITRQLSQDAVWSALARQSIARYRPLEAQSGVRFYEPTGGLFGFCLIKYNYDLASSSNVWRAKAQNSRIASRGSGLR